MAIHFLPLLFSSILLTATSAQDLPSHLRNLNSIDEENTWYYDESGEEEIMIRPQYDESKEYSYMPDNDDEVTHCKESSECPQYPFLICERKVCVHKGIFPIYMSEFFGIIVMAALLALANVGGIGGGGLIIPITMAMFTFTTKEAIALSGFTIFTGSVARFIYSWN